MDNQAWLSVGDTKNLLAVETSFPNGAIIDSTDIVNYFAADRGKIWYVESLQKLYKSPLVQDANLMFFSKIKR